MHALINMLDYAMPGIKNVARNDSSNLKRKKLCNFVEKHWHFGNICAMSEEDFISDYLKWAREKGYRPSKAKATAIYALAEDGIPTLPSNTPSTKILVLESVRILREIDRTLALILVQMQELAGSLPEYPVVRFT